MSYRKDYQSSINETNYTQNAGNYTHYESVDYSSFSTEKLEQLWKDTVYVLVCMKMVKNQVI